MWREPPPRPPPNLFWARQAAVELWRWVSHVHHHNLQCKQILKKWAAAKQCLKSETATVAVLDICWVNKCTQQPALTLLGSMQSPLFWGSHVLTAEDCSRRTGFAASDILFTLICGDIPPN